MRRIVDAAHPEKVILFGSTARGEAGRYSDIDVAVVVPDGTHRRLTERHIYRAMIGFKLPVDVVVVTNSDLDKYGDSPGLVYREILREGALLYAA
ncbi:MAG: nucleotidyltransferase domain-containing protein [Armatimonadota bacterium]|nr:nucleotidyltransferase domain-containing protein [Armatimonadota bacterium]